MKVSGLLSVVATSGWGFIEKLTDNKGAVIAIMIAFFAGGFVADIRATNAQQDVNTENIKMLRRSMVQMNHRIAGLAKGQERILCRFDGTTPSECDRDIANDLPPITIPPLQSNEPGGPQQAERSPN